MTVAANSPVSSPNVNAAWISKKQDDITVGVIGLNNTSDANSGNQIFNTQRLINELADVSGVVGEGDPNSKIYTSDNYGILNADRKAAIGILDAEIKNRQNEIDALTPIVNANALTVTSELALAASGTITVTTLTNRIVVFVGAASAVTLDVLPFGAAGGWINGAELRLIGNDATNTVKLTRNDAQYGLLLNGSVTLGYGESITLVYSSALERWCEVGRI